MVNTEEILCLENTIVLALASISHKASVADEGDSG